MKINNTTDIERIKKILRSIHLICDNACLFFPIDMQIKATDDFGLEISSFKPTSHYGNSLTSGFSYKKNGDHYDPCIAYAITDYLLAFNLSEFLALTAQDISEEDKKYILQFESCLVGSNSVFLCNFE